jgi:hypothetical protein
VKIELSSSINRVKQTPNPLFVAMPLCTYHINTIIAGAAAFAVDSNDAAE